MQTVITFPDLVAMELNHARQAHRTPMNSAHEGYAVLLEEVTELQAEVFRRDRNDLRTAEELVQVAAMAQRMAEDLGLVSRLT